MSANRLYHAGLVRPHGPNAAVKVCESQDAKPELALRRPLLAAELLDAMENQRLNEDRRLLSSRVLSVAFVARFRQQGTCP